MNTLVNIMAIAVIGLLPAKGKPLRRGVATRDSSYEKVMQWIDTVHCEPYIREQERGRYEGRAPAPYDDLEPTYYDSPWDLKGGWV